MYTTDSFRSRIDAMINLNDPLMVLAPEVTQADNDKQQVEPMLEKVRALPEGLNRPATLLADAGYHSENSVQACIDAGVEPLIAAGRQGHHPHWRERFSEPEPLPGDATPVAQMAHTLKTQAGKQGYGLRKQTVEPVFGIIKSVMKFRQLMLRGWANVRNEWTLVCLAWNVKSVATLRKNSVQRA